MSTSDHVASATVVPTMADLTASRSTKVVIKHVKCVHLNKHNYYLWEAQISAMLHGFELIEYVEGRMDLSSPVVH